MPYKYSDPMERGLTKFKLTKKQHNEIFPKQRINWTYRCEYYYNEHKVLIHKFTSWRAVILSTILFPLAVLMYGIGNIKEIYMDHYKLYHQKKYGTFVSDHVGKSDDPERYEKLIKLI